MPLHFRVEVLTLQSVTIELVCSPDQNNSIDTNRARGHSKTNEKVSNSLRSSLTSFLSGFYAGPHAFGNASRFEGISRSVCNFVACNARVTLCKLFPWNWHAYIAGARERSRKHKGLGRLNERRRAKRQRGRKGRKNISTNLYLLAFLKQRINFCIVFSIFSVAPLSLSFSLFLFILYVWNDFTCKSQTNGHLLFKP